MIRAHLAEIAEEQASAIEGIDTLILALMATPLADFEQGHIDIAVNVLAQVSLLLKQHQEELADA